MTESGHMHNGGGEGTSFAQGLGVEQQGLPDQDGSGGYSPFSKKKTKITLTDALQGINITPNFLFLMLFVGFGAWLVVIYWVRHNEPLANHVLGTSAAGSATAMADRRLVAGIKKTFPVQTSRNFGEFYVPIPDGTGKIIHSGHFGTPEHYETLKEQQSFSYSPQAQSAYSPATPYGAPAYGAASPLPSPPVPPVPAPSPQPTPLTYYPMSTPDCSQNPAFGQADPRAAYMMHVPATAGTRLRMIVNR